MSLTIYVLVSDVIQHLILTKNFALLCKCHGYPDMDGTRFVQPGHICLLPSSSDAICRILCH